MHIQRLDVHRLVPSGPDDLRQTFRVVLIGLVEPHLQRRFDPPSIQTLHVAGLA